MAVDFTLLPSEASLHDTEPSRFAWAVAFFIMVLAGVFLALVFWPQGVPTRTYKFWASIVLFPVGIPTWIVLRRYSVYEGRKLDVVLNNEAVRRFNARVFDAASIPLVLLGAAHRFSADPEENAAEYIQSGKLTLKTQDPIAKTGDPVKARWLTIPGLPHKSGSLEDDRRRRRQLTAWLFGQLLDELTPPINALPSEVPLIICLAASTGLAPEEDECLWGECWVARELGSTNFVRGMQIPPDLMMLDAWLDETLASSRLSAMLLVTVQLHPLLAGTPLPGTAEAASALLIVPRFLAEQHRMHRLADLHRPVRGLVSEPNDALTNASRWAGVQPAQILNGWQTGLDTVAIGTLREAAVKLSLTARVTDLDKTVGHAGIAAPGLALSCAASLLTDENSEQIIIFGREREVHCAVIKRPPTA